MQSFVLISMLRGQPKTPPSGDDIAVLDYHLNTHIIEKPALEHWIYCDCMVYFFEFLACFLFFYSLSLPLYFAFGQYFLSHSPCICICECLRVGPLILVLVETDPYT